MITRLILCHEYWVVEGLRKNLGVVHKWDHAILNIFGPLPHRHACYYWGPSTVVTKSLTVTSFMDDPLRVLKLCSEGKLL